MIRKPIATAVLGGLLVVVCDDGTLWEYDPDGKWVEREPIPGTAAGVRAESGRRYQGPFRTPQPRDGERQEGSFAERRNRNRRGKHHEREPERRHNDRRGPRRENREWSRPRSE